MWLKLILAAVLLFGTLAAVYVMHRRVKGERALTFPGDGQARERLAAEELEQLIATYRKGKAATPAVAAQGQPSPAPGPTAAQPAGATVKPKAVFLNGPNKLLYLVLKAALPDHQIFAQVRLADAVQVTGQPATPQARAQLAQARVDFVICNKELNVVALLDVTDGNRADDMLKRQVAPQITAAGGRYLRIAPNAIPKPGEARALVCGIQG